MANRFIVNSIRSKERMQQIVQEAFDKEHYVIFSWQVGDLMTVKQRGLFHIWLKIWIANVLKKDEADVTDNELAGIKRTIKARFYHETAHDWMVRKVREVFPPYREVLDYTSVNDWTTAQTNEVMTWVQVRAAEQGVILESKGEFAEMKKSQNK